MLFAVGGRDELTASEAIAASPSGTVWATSGQSFECFRIRKKLRHLSREQRATVTLATTRG
jgi:hypothetical protein